MKSVLTVIVFWCLSLAVFGQDTLRTDLFGYSTRFYLPEVAAGDTVTLVANNRSAAMVWYMNVGDWGEITILVNETQVIHGGWSLPIKRGFFPVWRGPDPQPAMRTELASGYNTIQFCFKERVSVPVVRAPRMVSWVVIRDSHWSNTDPFLIGAQAILVAFNLFVFFFFIERSYLYFALAHSFFVLYMFTVNGYFIAKVYPENPIYNTRVMWFLGNLFYLSYVAFIHNFFGKTSWSRQLLKLLTGMVVISTLLLLLPFHIDPLFKPI
ncbi:MAG: 7TM diverse intracellular signaling domain-containing protein, partial [Salibacteraceae bacterium]